MTTSPRHEVSDGFAAGRYSVFDDWKERYLSRLVCIREMIASYDVDHPERQQTSLQAGGFSIRTARNNVCLIQRHHTFRLFDAVNLFFGGIDTKFSTQIRFSGDCGDLVLVREGCSSMGEAVYMAK
jgi:hypothetical protein